MSKIGKVKLKGGATLHAIPSPKTSFVIDELQNFLEIARKKDINSIVIGLCDDEGNTYTTMNCCMGAEENIGKLLAEINYTLWCADDDE